MAENEGIFEKVLALLQWRVVGEKEAIDSTKKVEKASVAASAEIGAGYKQATTQLGKYAQQLSKAGMTTQEITTYLREEKLTTKEVTEALRDAGLATGELTGAAKEQEKGLKRLDWSWRGIGRSIQWAAYRFLFALGIYMLFRKALRTINEAIQESIRLWKEYSQQQQKLEGLLLANQELFGEQVGTLEEWNEWMRGASKELLVSQLAMTKMTAAAQEANSVLGLTAEQMQDLIELGTAVARVKGLMEGNELDYAAGVELVTRAVEGQDAALRALGIRQDQMLSDLGLTEEAWRRIGEVGGEQAQAQIRYAYIIEHSYDLMADASSEAMSSMERDAAQLAATSEDTKTQLGKSLGGLEAVFKPVVVLFEKGFLALGDAIGRFSQQVTAAIIILKTLFPVMQNVGQLANNILISLGLVAQATAGRMGDLSGATKKAAAETIDSVSAWLKLFGAIDKAKELMDKTKRIFGNVKDIIESAKDVAEDAAEAFQRLGKLVADALQTMQQSMAEAKQEFEEGFAETFEDQRKDELEAEEKYADKAADARKRALDRIAKLRRDAVQDEKEERQDLNLRLHQMEEDHLLDMKHLREQFTMDLEEAARKRDAVAMRRLQREYGLERRQREEAYRLQRHQTVEAWKLDRQQRQRDLRQEIKEIRDALADELAELRAEKAEELAEIRANWEERRAELTKQYEQELADLKVALGRRLTEGIVEWANQNNIPLETVKSVVMALAEQYGLDANNLWNNLVLPEMQMLEQLRQAWLAVAAAASGVPTTAGTGTEGTTKPKHMSFATGGLAVATAPTMVKVGEAGPELFGAIPLGKLGGRAAGMRGGMDVRLTIDGTQSGKWSGDFETQTLRILRNILQESL